MNSKSKQQQRNRSKTTNTYASAIRIERVLFLLVVLTGISIVYVDMFLWNTFEEGSASSSTTLESSTWSSSSQHNKHDNSNGDNIKKKNVEPILRILRRANMSESEASDPSLHDDLPSWEEVVDRFGPRPIVEGLDRCAAYNEMVPYTRDRMLASAGPFNSGTNFLHEMLRRNCEVPFTKNGRTGIMWQVPWGKHQSPRFRFENKAKGMNKASRPENTLPVVLLRDPYSWFQSMCKVRYAAHWYHVVPDHCPNFIATQIERDWYNKTKLQLRKHYNGDVWKIDNVFEKANYTLDSNVIPLWVRYKSETRNHDSLAHMWKDWYDEYYNVDWPRLMVRLEDLVFYPHETVRKICECVDGKYVGDDNLSMTLDSAKAKDDKIHGKDRTGLVRAMIAHVTQNRTKGMTLDDAAFAKQTLEDSVMRTFGYKSPT
mmetsp:Transcript_24051/g.56870  ORF Transcript_24051/g.56870 Transcript_24051/m.56870 type:complete len:429 (-) Transcript_24051:1887-3173(-)